MLTDTKEWIYWHFLWLDGISKTFVDEVGAMNIMFLINDELILPSTRIWNYSHWCLLRNSVLTITSDWGYKVTERPIKMEEN